MKDYFLGAFAIATTGIASLLFGAGCSKPLSCEDCRYKGDGKEVFDMMKCVSYVTYNFENFVSRDKDYLRRWARCPVTGRP